MARDVRTTLEGAGAHVFQASTAADALELVDEVKLAAAVLDYTRSIEEGHPIARRLTALNPLRRLYEHAAYPLDRRGSAPKPSRAPGTGGEHGPSRHR